jgi:hypothetical protein
MGRRALASVVLAFALTLPAAPPAGASSLVFVKRSDGNVWLAAADGTQQFQVTTNGTPANPYFSPTQSERGTIEVARGAALAGQVFRVDRLGSRLSSPFAVTLAPAILDPVISPDGRKVALWTASIADVSAPCYADFHCFEVSNADRYNQLSRPAWMTFQHPAWLGSSRLLLFRGSGALSYADLAGFGFTPWFGWGDYHPSAAAGLGEWIEGVASWDAREIALVAREDAPARFVIQVFSGAVGMATGDLSTYRPSSLPCEVTAPDGGSGADPRDPGAPALRSLSFSPHGTAIAFAFKGAIYVSTLADCKSRKVITGADDPFWGPRSVAPPRLSVSLARVKTIGALLRGLRVSVALNTPGTVALQLTEGRRTLARGVVKVRARGRRGVVVLRPSPAVARRLRGLRQLRATIRASAVGFRRPVRTVELTVRSR